MNYVNLTKFGIMMRSANINTRYENNDEEENEIKSPIRIKYEKENQYFLKKNK
ncbi:hypothetical protein PIROE2DRAFT_13102 [Piromyces sp. E2]|nr:hypothetical protein PIROE2DRAFT_13102 [Piromyces sp. E2]|eukprot:OUM60985.1 hypothetical protein PIROE2DRAFT_13102 [Piromyces sp. E2]